MHHASPEQAVHAVRPEPAAACSVDKQQMEAASAGVKALRSILPVDRSEWLAVQPAAWQQEAIPGLALDEPVLGQLQVRACARRVPHSRSRVVLPRRALPNRV